MEKPAKEREEVFDAMLADTSLMEFMQAGSGFNGDLSLTPDDEEEWLARGKVLVDAIAVNGGLARLATISSD